MLDICFGDSECGMLKFALQKSNNVIALFHLLDLGKIKMENFQSCRKEWLNEFYSFNRWKKHLFHKKQFKSLNFVLRQAKKGEAIRIWWTEAPFSKCGFFCLVYLLQGINCKITTVYLPNYTEADTKYEASWGLATPNYARELSEQAKTLTFEERTEIALEWQKLTDDNKELRVNIDGILTSVDNDFFDKEILSCSPEGEFLMRMLVGKMIGTSTHCISDSFIEYRICTLIDKGAFSVVRRFKKDSQEMLILKKQC